MSIFKQQIALLTLCLAIVALCLRDNRLLCQQTALLSGFRVEKQTLTPKATLFFMVSLF